MPSPVLRAGVFLVSSTILTFRAAAFSTCKVPLVTSLIADTPVLGYGEHFRYIPRKELGVGKRMLLKKEKTFGMPLQGKRETNRNIMVPFSLAMSSSSTRTGYDTEQLRLLDADECIIVNEKDEVLGHGSKKFCHLMENIAAGKALHRAFSVFLFSTDGKLLLQKRSDDKILFPKRWTNTCCSHPLYNDEELDDPATEDAAGVKRAVVRKLEHELGIKVGSVPIEKIEYMTRIVYKAAVGEDAQWGEHEVDYILLAVADVTCDLNPNEVSEIRYVAKEELAGLLAEEERGDILLSPWFKLVAQKWLPRWWDAVLSGSLHTCKDTGTIHLL